MLTYNDIYEALRKEKYSEQLQQLPKRFLIDVSEYFQQKKDMGERQQDLFSAAILKTKKQFENAVSIFKELMMRRKKKLLNLAFVAAETGISKRDYENMMEFEKEMFDEIMKSIDKAEKRLEGELKGKGIERKNIMVLFLQDTEKFLDLSGEEIGPFKKGDVANLSKEVVNILEEDNKVEIMEE